ncbi:FeoA family protein [Cryobacterium sp. SO2]|uniref:FeoA family protein n=1 Tax=Cryobacterium sp. SO2 TaxID=1897060 RepID=UPI00223D4A31|nr:FeoA family protein [Cryobacterium sp. SO2]WEO78759.1 FeoA family protein [Cryobacterium sp. SO2]
MTRANRAPASSGDSHPTGAITLDRLSVGQAGRILTVSGDQSEYGRRLVERLGALGILPGATISALRRAPLGDPVVYRVCDFDLCLRAAQAALVTVAVAAADATGSAAR